MAGSLGSQSPGIWSEEYLSAQVPSPIVRLTQPSAICKEPFRGGLKAPTFGAGHGSGERAEIRIGANSWPLITQTDQRG